MADAEIRQLRNMAAAFSTGLPASALQKPDRIRLVTMLKTRNPVFLFCFIIRLLFYLLRVVRHSFKGVGASFKVH